MEQEQVLPTLRMLSDAMRELQGNIDKFLEMTSEPEFFTHNINELLRLKKCSRRALNACRAYHIETMGELMNIGYNAFMKFRNVGYLTAHSIEDYVEQEYGYKWK